MLWKDRGILSDQGVLGEGNGISEAVSRILLVN